MGYPRDVLASMIAVCPARSWSRSIANTAGPCGAMIIRGSGCAVLETTTTSRPVSGVARAAGSTVTSKRGACALAALWTATAATHAAVTMRNDVRMEMSERVGVGVALPNYHPDGPQRRPGSGKRETGSGE